MRISFFLKFLLVGVSILLISCDKSKKEDTEKPKIFRFNIQEGFTSMDPAFARNQSNIWVVNQLFNGLVELNEEMKVVPSIAQKWEISEDGKVYTFNLRNDVYYHESKEFKNGIKRNVVASDFVYSFQRIISSKVSSTGAWIFNDKVLREEDGSISDTCFKAMDDYTFRIYLQEPHPAFLQILTMPYAFVVPKEVVEKYGKDFREHPIGTGPFKLKHLEENTSLIMVKNESYWKKDKNGANLPYLDAVNVSFIDDKKVAFLTFTKGKLDIFSGLDENSKDMALNVDGTLKEKFVDQFNYQKIPYLNTEYLGFQLDDQLDVSKNHIFQNKKVRQAINYAIDREELINFIRNGIGRPADAGIIPSALPSFNPKIVKGYEYNPEKAEQLLKEAGFPEGKGLPTLELFTQTNSQYRDMAELIQKHCEEVGIRITISTNLFATHQEMVDNSRVNFFRGSWLGDYPDGENYLTLFYSKNFAPQGPNKTHFKNEAFDALYDQAKSTTDIEERWNLYQQMDKIVVEEAPVIVLYYDEVIRFTQKNVKGIQADAMNSLKLEGVDIQ